jgi:hypothetical protein
MNDEPTVQAQEHQKQPEPQPQQPVPIVGGGTADLRQMKEESH